MPVGQRSPCFGCTLEHDDKNGRQCRRCARRLAFLDGVDYLKQTGGTAYAAAPVGLVRSCGAVPQLSDWDLMVSFDG